MAGPSDLLVNETDGFAADFTYYVLPITGTLAAVETGVDAANFEIVNTPITGTLAALEAGADASEMTATVSVAGVLDAIEVDVDVANFSFIVGGLFVPYIIDADTFYEFSVVAIVRSAVSKRPPRVNAISLARNNIQSPEISRVNVQDLRIIGQ